MTGLDYIRRQVEDHLSAWCEQPTSTEERHAPVVQVQQASEFASDNYGELYQRCGGGRRIIRKKIGGE